MSDYIAEIGHEKAQSVIDSITSSYAAEGQSVPMMQQPGSGFPPPPPGFPGKYLSVLLETKLTIRRYASSAVWHAEPRRRRSRGSSTWR